MNIFEVATRNKYRFQHKGSITVEDLWDLSVGELDDIFKKLKAKVKETEEESLLAKKSSANSELETKIEIIKYIVTTKLAEAEKRKDAAAKAAKRQKIMGIIANKEDEELNGMTLEQLNAMLSTLE